MVVARSDQAESTGLEGVLPSTTFYYQFKPYHSTHL